MKKIPTRQAVGHVLCHDMTQIIPGVTKDARFRKGHIVTHEDIPVLLSMGKEYLFVWEKQPGMLHEDEAALRLQALCQSDGMEASAPREGKIELRAKRDGLFFVDTAGLNKVNALGDIIIATRHSGPVTEGQKLCGTRIIPLVIPEEKLAAAECAVQAPLLQLLPYVKKTCALIVTGSEVKNGLVEDAFTPVIEKKLSDFGIRIISRCTPGDGTENIRSAIDEARALQPDMILCTGGMSVDPDDNTPGAIKACGADIITYGAPVLPGAMFLMSYLPEGTPLMGLPGCVMYAARTIFDLILPRVAAGVRLRREDFTTLGEGGLCLGCDTCRYPDCSFGK